MRVGRGRGTVSIAYTSYASRFKRRPDDVL
jgi:hypothetical protein